MRTARDYLCGIADEPRWNRAARQFDRLRLLSEDFRVIGQYAGRDALVPERAAPPRRLVRTHVEGQVSLAADRAALHRFLPLVTGGGWQAPAPDAGRADEMAVMASLRADGDVDPVSLSFIRRLAAGDRWQLHTGLQIRRLRLFPDGAGGFVMNAEFLGAERRDAAALGISALPAGKPAMRLAPPPDGLTLTPDNGSAKTPLFLAGLEVDCLREGMRPHVALGADTPQMITAGRLEVRLAVRLLANDAAREASRHDRLAAHLTLENDASRMIFSLGRLQVTARRELVDPGGGPAMIHLGMRAEPGGGDLLLVRETAGQE